MLVIGEECTRPVPYLVCRVHTAARTERHLVQPRRREVLLEVPTPSEVHGVSCATGCTRPCLTEHRTHRSQLQQMLRANQNLDF